MANISKWEVKNLVYTWFRKITNKAPVEELLEMLSSDTLLMTFPEQTLKSHDEFKEWYAEVTGKYFDQVHALELLDVELYNEVAQVKLIVNWQTLLWEPPEPFSRMESYDIYQVWEVVFEEGKPVIAEYDVKEVLPN